MVAYELKIRVIEGVLVITTL